jgi:acetolactate synthase regulatory subunit
VRRGFEPVAVVSAPGRAPGTFDVSLTVESARPVEVLSRHLANLYDVARVEVRR